MKVLGVDSHQFTPLFTKKNLRISPNLTQTEIDDIRNEESPAVLQVQETTTAEQREAILRAQKTHTELRKLEQTLRQVDDLFQTVQTLLFAQVRQMCSIHLMQFIP